MAILKECPKSVLKDGKVDEQVVRDTCETAIRAFKGIKGETGNTGVGGETATYAEHARTADNATYAESVFNCNGNKALRYWTGYTPEDHSLTLVFDDQEWLGYVRIHFPSFEKTNDDGTTFLAQDSMLLKIMVLLPRDEPYSPTNNYYIRYETLEMNEERHPWYSGIMMVPGRHGVWYPHIVLRGKGMNYENIESVEAFGQKIVRNGNSVWVKK